MLTDIIAILFLAIVEGLLSFDNALVLAVMVKPLPLPQQKKALTYGIIGAFAFRIIALFLATSILSSPWIRFGGGAYLVWLGLHNLLEKDDSESKVQGLRTSFVWTIVSVELTDLVFSIDSILASIAVSDKIEIVFLGGCLGIIMMRFASSQFIKILDRFPRLNYSAFIIVMIVGFKLLLESQTFVPFNFHHGHLEFYVFWISMFVSLGMGFTSKNLLERSLK